MTYKASMEMVGSCVKVEDDGTSSIVMHVLFTDTNDNEVRYPWESLKQVVIEWMKVESEESYLDTLKSMFPENHLIKEAETKAIKLLQESEE